MARLVTQLVFALAISVVMTTSFAALPKDQPMCSCQDIEDDPSFRKCTCGMGYSGFDYYKSVNKTNLVGALSNCERRGHALVRFQDEQTLVIIRDMLAGDRDTSNLVWTDATIHQGKFVYLSDTETRPTPVDPFWWEDGSPGSAAEYLYGVQLVYIDQFTLPKFRVVRGTRNARYICEVKRS